MILSSLRIKSFGMKDVSVIMIKNKYNFIYYFPS